MFQKIKVRVFAGGNKQLRDEPRPRGAWRDPRIAKYESPKTKSLARLEISKELKPFPTQA